MEATFTETYVTNGRNYSDKKETTDAYVLIGIGPSRSDVDELATLKVYKSRTRNAATVDVSLWVSASAAGIFVAGTGRARGYDFNRAAHAAEYAFASAGIKLSANINDNDDIRDALRAVGIACGYNTVRVIEL